MEKVLVTMIDNFSTWVKGDSVQVSPDTAIRLVNELKVAKYEKNPRVIESEKIKEEVENEDEKVSRSKKVVRRAPNNKAL